ncbi:MAG: ATP-binding protein [Clostridium sp.]|nr:ATP-binding protein [Clostridium sp.]
MKSKMEKEYQKEYNLEDLEKALDSIPYQISLQNDKGQYIYVNNALADQVNMKKEDIIGRAPCEILDEDNYKLLDEILPPSESDDTGIFSEIKSPIDNKWYDLYRSIVKSNGKTFIASIANELNMNMTRVYNNLYYAREKDSMDLLGCSDLIYNRDQNIFSSVEFKKRMTLLCEDLQHKVNSDGISIYLVDENSDNVNLFLKTGKFIELCQTSKRNLFNSRDKLKKYDCNNLLENCPKCCKLFNDKNISDNWQVTIHPIKCGSTAIGVMVLYYSNKYEIKFTADELINSICYKFGILCENKTMKLKLEKESKENIENRSRLKFFMDTTRDFWAIIKRDGTMVQTSKNILTNLGWSKNHMMKCKYQDYIHPDDMESTRKYVRAIRKTGQDQGYNLINRFKCKDGTYKTIKWCWVHNLSKDIVTLTGKDITLQRKLEEENQKIHAELELESSKLEFFSNMSHEFRAPLNIILNSTQLMDIQLKNNDIDKASKNLKYIKQNSYRLLKLTNNILDTSRIDYGAYDLNLENCNIVEVIENIVTSVADYIKSFNKNIIFDTEEEEIITQCDTNMIERIMLNLLSNALKYVNENGTIEVKLSLDKSTNSVLASVWDDGIAISKEHADKIFERFNRVDKSLTRNCEGGGIGLSITKSFVEMHKGRIWVNTEVEKGAEIIFSLPIKKVSPRLNTIVKPLDTKIEKCNIEFSDIYSLF